MAEQPVAFEVRRKGHWTGPAGRCSLDYDDRFLRRKVLHTDAGTASFTVATNTGRGEQARRGMLAFKMIMGLITGISVVVGGVGVMNVLLVSITERTREIGVRKATGARRRDVLAQFLAESVAISLVGCGVGLALGLLTVWAASPLIRQGAEIPFEAVLTTSTVGVVLGVALVIGLVFWTMIWGIAGALLATPITAALVLASREVDSLKWVATLLSEEPDQRRVPTE